MGYSLPTNRGETSSRTTVNETDIEEGVSQELNVDRRPVTSRRSKTWIYRTVGRLTWLLWGFLILLLWLWSKGAGSNLSYVESHDTVKISLDGLKFVAASHPFIRYVGRWNPTADNTRRDASFPGAYFDISLDGTATMLLSLHNIQALSQTSSITSTDTIPSFLTLTNASTNAAPTSLLARVDEDDYLIFPNAESLVAVRTENLDINTRHEIRIVAPMLGGKHVETLQFEGIWIDESGQLLPFETHPIENTLESQLIVSKQSKMLEIVTDVPGSMDGRDRSKNSGITRGILGGVMGWEYLLGEMFGADHATTGMNGMCLIQDCIGGRGSPIGLADVFFQSGPLGTKEFAEPWHFQTSVPNVMVMNLGSSDWESFQTHKGEYNNKTSWDLSALFEDTYVSLIKAIRTLAYPNATDLPIFVMRPFRGQLEQSTHSVVDRLRLEGDPFIYWLDTSGWLDTELDLDGGAAAQDFYMDEDSPLKEWRLTERGNQRVAILLHMHVCQYLAQDAEKCVFLPPETYHGEAFDAGRYFEDEVVEEKVAADKTPKKVSG